MSQSAQLTCAFRGKADIAAKLLMRDEARRIRASVPKSLTPRVQLTLNLFGRRFHHTGS